MEGYNHDFNPSGGPHWDDQDLYHHLANSLAIFDGVNPSEDVPLLDLAELAQDSTFPAAEIVFYEISRMDFLADLDTWPQIDQNAHFQNIDIMTLNSPTNTTFTSLSWNPGINLESPSTLSSSAWLSPAESLTPWTPSAAGPGELQMPMLGNQISQQTEPSLDNATITIGCGPNIQGLSPNGSPSHPRASGKLGPRLAISARERRKQEKPEKCPICNEGFDYILGLGRHVAAKHRERAHEFGFSTTRFPCLECGKTFARKDHLKRHERRFHAKGARKKP
ncbi:hypothetical protein QBC43DRAFT_37451 [Cladorrhinum sp. PSN259]|nr:hypothetical protein QBC43DRAFT_37451 [Cladorrhinum sp. PSN259]